MNTLKQQLPFIKKAFVFLLGSWIFAYGTASVVTIFWLESFQNISVEGIRSYFQDPFPSIFVSALKNVRRRLYPVLYIARQNSKRQILATRHLFSAVLCLLLPDLFLDIRRKPSQEGFFNARKLFSAFRKLPFRAIPDSKRQNQPPDTRSGFLTTD